MLIVALLFAVSSLGVWLQMVAYLPGHWRYERPPHGLRWWVAPLEFHRAAALPAITGTINAIAVQPGTPSRIWIAGNAGLLFSSDDEGRHWTKFDYDVASGEFRKFGAARSAPPPAPPPSAPAAGAQGKEELLSGIRMRAPGVVATLYAAELQASGANQAAQMPNRPADRGELSVSASSVTFPDTRTGATSSPQTIEAYNPGKVNVAIQDVIVEPDSRNFDAKSDCLKRTLEPGQRCTTILTFHPRSGGRQAGSLVFMSSATSSRTLIPLAGMGIAPPPANLPAQGPPNALTTPPVTKPAALAKTPTGPPDLHGLGFTDASGGWVVATSEFEYATVDAGVTWQFRSPTVQGRRTPESIASGSSQWKVGANGSVQHSRDGGQSWEPVTRGAIDPADLDAGGAHWVLLPPWYLLVTLPVCLFFGLVARLTVEEAPSPDDGVSEIFAPDRPLEPGDVDVLNLRAIASGLSRFLRHEKTMPPLTVAISGEWGSGKSSLMNLLKNDLKSYSYRPVWFNAWHHQTEEHLLAALLQTVRLEAVPPWMGRYWAQFRWSLLRRRLARNWIALALLASAFLLIYAIETTIEGSPYNLSLLSFLGTVTGATDLSAAQVLKSLPLPHFVTVTGAITGLTLLSRGLRAFGVNPAALLTTASSGSSIKDLDAQTGFRQRFAVQFRDVTEALGPRQLVIFIDDLDRCKPDNVREILEAVNFLVSSGGCFVILGMARGQVERSVGLSFREIVVAAKGESADDALAGYARKYLDKLINIEVPVPVPTTEQQRRLFVDDAPADGAAGPQSPKAKSRQASDDRWEKRWRLSAQAAEYVLPVVVAGLVGSSAYQIGKESVPWLSVKIAQVQHNVAAQRAKKALEATQPPDQSPTSDWAQAPATPPAGNAGSDVTGNAPPGTPPTQAGSTSAAPTTDQTPAVREAETSVPAPWMLTWPFTLTLAGLLLAGRSVLLVASGGVERDSPSFETALRIWHPLVTAKTNSPRAAKRFLNRVRYIAMRQRREDETSPLIRGLFPNRIAIQPGLDRSDPIHDSLLVTLAALEQFDSGWLASEENLRNVLDGKVTPSADCPTLADILGKARTDHEEAAKSGRVKPLSELESCRRRFLDLWPSVTVR
jgi:hypothetical protein